MYACMYTRVRVRFHITFRGFAGASTLALYSMPWHTMLVQVMSCHVRSYHVTPCKCRPCHVMSVHVISCHGMSVHGTSCSSQNAFVMSRHVSSCHAMSCQLMSCKLAAISVRDLSWPCWIVVCFSVARILFLFRFTAAFLVFS